jgi:hypothetical protein
MLTYVISRNDPKEENLKEWGNVEKGIPAGDGKMMEGQNASSA